jgi:hypothetical protein
MLFIASRDPIRNVAIIDAFAVARAYWSSLSRLVDDGNPSIYLVQLIRAPSVMRLGLATLLYFLRPRAHETTSPSIPLSYEPSPCFPFQQIDLLGESVYARVHSTQSVHSGVRRASFLSLFSKERSTNPCTQES